MSQPAPTPASPASRRSFAGLVGAMLVTVLVGGGWYLLGRPHADVQPVKTVPWAFWVTSGRSDGKLAMLAPAALPRGWRPTSASYVSGVDPRWHLGMLTPQGKFVGLEESPRTTQDLVEQYVDENATRGKDVTVGGARWQSWTDAGGDYAVVRTLAAPGGGQERVLVYGSAPDAQVRSFAESLSATARPTDSAGP